MRLQEDHAPTELTNPVNRAGRDEQGFTLIELLVVVIIIGILAAIAIPTFLAQQDSARDAGAISYVRNAVNAQQSYFAENGEYTRFRSDLEDHGLNLDRENYDYTEYAYSSPRASGSRVDYGSGYCVDAKHNESDRRYRATDQAQNPEEGSCDALGGPEE